MFLSRHKQTDLFARVENSRVVRVQDWLRNELQTYAGLFTFTVELFNKCVSRLEVQVRFAGLLSGLVEDSQELGVKQILVQAIGVAAT